MRRLKVVGLVALLGTIAMAADWEQRVEHGTVENGGVKIHYASLGKGPLVVMIHGFPDFWYSWRHQMEGLSGSYRVVAIDQRGYNLSDKPKGGENYRMPLLVSDVAAVIQQLGNGKPAVVVGHDWGGMVAWSLAAARPELVERLIIVNLPHPNGLMRELAKNPEQQKNSQYARDFQKEGAHLKLTAEGLAKLAPEAERGRYQEAFARSDFEAMLHYYKQNYPREPYAEGPAFPQLKLPVLQFHGLKDWALLPGALNDTWKWLAGPYTLVTLPNAGHWSHWDSAATVTATMKHWLSTPLQ